VERQGGTGELKKPLKKDPMLEKKAECYIVLWSKNRKNPSLQMQTYFWLLPKNNICEPEPGNDFCDVMTFVSLWPIRFHDTMKLERSSQRIPHAVVLGLLELNCDWPKIPTSQKSFPGLGSQTLFFGRDK